MKTISKFTLSAIFLIFALTPGAFAQKGKFGATPADSVICIRNLNFIKDEIKTKSYETAYPLFSEIIRICPTASQNTYLYGIQIMQHFAGNETDKVKKQQYVDTILMLYDKRFELFGRPSKGETAFRKAGELMDYRHDQHSEILNLYEIAAAENYRPADTYVQIMQQVKFMYEKQLLSGDATIAKYDNIIKAVEKLPANTETEEARKTIEGLFLAMPELNSCENLVAMYTPKFEANPNDMDLIRAIRYRLSNAESCKETKLFADVVEAGYRLEPDAESAFQLAQLFLIKGDKEKAMSYMQEAIEQETDNLQKSKYMLQVSNIHYKDNKIHQALSLARQVTNINPNAGEAYMIMANCYAHSVSNASGCEPFKGRDIYWLVVDLLQKAKSVDSSLAGSANSAISTYTKMFPTYNDIFLFEYTEGNSYTVDCNGITGTTTIRSAPR
jgi:tetratricopeptide (TPR) repeat protein